MWKLKKEYVGKYCSFGLDGKRVVFKQGETIPQEMLDKMGDAGINLVYKSKSKVKTKD